MRRQTPVASLLYSHLFPAPGPADPPNFQTHLARDLIPEIRIETATFYGSLDSIEARYPGLNYCHRPHRMRLGRFPHHARLFDIIDRLGITNQEVMDLARWEGTLWARQRFERDEGIKVRDTTGDGIIPWIDSRLIKKEHGKGIRVKVETAVEVTQDAHADGPYDCTPQVEEFLDDEDEDEDNDNMDHDETEPIEGDDDIRGGLDDPITGTSQSLSHDLNRRILAAIAARQRSGTSFEINPELEAYLKELVESGQLSSGSRPADGPLADPSTTIPNGSTTMRQPAI